MIQRAGRALDQLRRDPGVHGRGGDEAMAEQRLDDAHVSSVLQQVRGEAVAPMPISA